MNPMELPNKISALNGQLDFMKAMIMDQYNRMVERIMELINEAKNLLMMYLSKGTEWVSQHIIEIKMKIEPIVQKVKDLIKKAKDWVKKQLQVATEWIADKIATVTSFVDAQLKAIEDFIQKQTQKIVEKEAELMIKAQEKLL